MEPSSGREINSEKTRISRRNLSSNEIVVTEFSLNKESFSNRYEINDQIATGGMGSIHRCHDKQLNRDLAIKVLIDGDEKSEESYQRFYQEAQINGQLQHPGIVPVYEIGSLPDSKPFFAMKLVEGETLKSLLDKRPSADFDRVRFLNIFEQVCQTMAYAHSRKVIHRDLKPANIMVGEFGEVQVMDWGVAKILNSDTNPLHSDQTVSQKNSKTIVNQGDIKKTLNSHNSSSYFQTCDGVIFGTLAYMSPEQARGEHCLISERSDVFGLGAILCEILTGITIY